MKKFRWPRRKYGTKSSFSIIYAGMSVFVPVERASEATSGSPQKTTTPEKRSGCKEILQATARRLYAFHARFRGFLTRRTRNVAEQSRK
jgi:hypothetical protein